MFSFITSTDKDYPPIVINGQLYVRTKDGYTPFSNAFNTITDFQIAIATGNLPSGAYSINDGTGMVYWNGTQLIAKDGKPLWRNSANRCNTILSQSASVKDINSRRSHINKSDLPMTYVALMFNAWTGTEVALTGTSTIAVAVEYPAGTYQMLTFSGANTGTLPTMGFLTTDTVKLTTPIPPNAQFWVKVYGSNANGFPFYANAYGSTSTLGEGMYYSGTAGALAGSGVGDCLSALGTSGGGANPSTIAPCAILSYSNRPSVIGVGDSRFSGVYEQAGGVNMGLCGHFERGVSPYYATINVAVGGEAAYGFAAPSQSALRVQLAKLAGTHVVCNYAVNDIALRTLAQIKASWTTIAGYFSPMPVIPVTTEPLTTSTDNWATTANQTINANDAIRTSWNDFIRAGLAPTLAPNIRSDFVDVARVVEIAADSNTPPNNPFDGGKWVSNGTALAFVNNDGAHLKPLGNQMVADAGVYGPWRFIG